MANDYFQFKQFTIWQQQCAMKVTTDGCLFGAWVALSANEQMGKCADAYSQVEAADTTSFSVAVRKVQKEQQAEGKMLPHFQLSTLHAPLYTSEPRSTVNGHRVLDIGTGTGLLSLMLAQKTEAFIDAIEIDPAAAAQAAQNITASPWANRLKVMEGDITQLTLPHLYDVIISNPPFFENQLASPNEGRQKALHASALGLQDLFTRMSQLLQPQGRVFLLLPAYRHSELAALTAQHNWHINQLVWVKQTPKHNPFRMMVQLSSNPVTTITETLIIKDENQQYSAEFVALLKDYYLHL